MLHKIPNKLKLSYKEYASIRFFIQLIIIVLIYYSIQLWQLKDVVKGQAPRIVAETMQGIDFDSQDQLPMLIYFWSTWCPICEFQSGNIEAIAADYKVISIASWSEPGEVMQYLHENNLSFPVVMDEFSQWSEKFSIKAVPMMFFVNKKGEIEFIEKGYTTEYGMRARMWWLQNK